MPAANKRQLGCMFAKSYACMSFSESQGGNPEGSFSVPSPVKPPSVGGNAKTTAQTYFGFSI